MTSWPGADEATTPSCWRAAQKRSVSQISRPHDADGTRDRTKVRGPTKTEAPPQAQELKEKLATEQHTELEASPPPDATLSKCAET
jgi:hypothetical protein